jgi:hypothetical protein
MTSFYEIFDERVVWREIKNVVLHDPGGHGEDGFGVDPVCCGRILDQLNQPVLKDDLAGRHRNVLPNHELLGDDRPFAACRPLPVFDEVSQSFGEISAASLNCHLRDFGIRPNEVGWRSKVKKLSNCE